MEIDFKVKRQLKRKIDLTIRLNKTTFKKKKKKIQQLKDFNLIKLQKI